MTDDYNKRPIVLSAKNVRKDFHLPHEKNSSLKSAIVNVFKKKDKEVDTQHALRGVSFDIHEGEFFGILGRNGSGKSTLLKILAEIYQPTKGMVSHTGKLVPFIELGVGFNPELTGRENVYLNGALLGFSEREIDERYEEIVAFAELEEFMDQKLKNYSSGMQVRLAFSVATRAEADILLVDEVLAVGDADFQRKCFDFFKSLKRTGKTVIFVTHSMDAVREYCDRAILINEGLITHEDNADKVADEYLKLFNAGDDVSSEDRESNRWGNFEVKIDTFSVEVTAKKILINATLQSKGSGSEDVVFGYRFLSPDGDLVMGGSNMNAKNAEKIQITPYSRQTISYEIENVLGAGVYDVSATARSTDSVTVYDAWDNITRIKVSKTESHYPVVAPATIVTDKGE